MWHEWLWYASKLMVCIIQKLICTILSCVTGKSYNFRVQRHHNFAGLPFKSKLSCIVLAWKSYSPVPKHPSICNLIISSNIFPRNFTHLSSKWKTEYMSPTAKSTIPMATGCNFLYTPLLTVHFEFWVLKRNWKKNADTTSKAGINVLI